MTIESGRRRFERPHLPTVPGSRTRVPRVQGLTGGERLLPWHVIQHTVAAHGDRSAHAMGNRFRFRARQERTIACGRRSWLFCGSDRDAQGAAVVCSLIATPRPNDVDPQAWPADVLARMAEHPIPQIDDLMPLRWKQGCEPARLANLPQLRISIAGDADPRQGPTPNKTRGPPGRSDAVSAGRSDGLWVGRTRRRKWQRPSGTASTPSHTCAP